MGEPIGRGLKQLMGVGGIEAVAESERIRSVRKLKDRYWSLKRGIDKKESDLETMKKQNSLKILLGHDENRPDIDQLRKDINSDKVELRSISDGLEEKDVHIEHIEPVHPVVDEKEGKKDLFDMEFDTKNLFDMEFDTRNLFDVGDENLPEFGEIEEDIEIIPDADEITPRAHEDDGGPARPVAKISRKVKQFVKVRKRKVISSSINDIICTANRFERDGSIEGAIAALEKELAAHDHHEEMLYQLGNLHFKNDNVVESERYYRWAIERNSHSFRSLNNLGILLQKQGRLEDAIISFNQALEINDKYERAWYNLGSIFMEIDPPMLDEACIFFRRALECDPQYERAREKLNICDDMVA